MTPDDIPLNPDDLDEALAAETALGLLDGNEADEIAQRLSHDADFAARVRAWHERLAGLAERLTPVMPPAGARQRIKERLGHAHQPLSVDPTARLPWWRGPLGIVTGMVAVAAVAAFLWFPGLNPIRPSGDPAYQAQLVSADQGLRADASLDGRILRVAMTQGSVPDGRDLELWWVADDGTAPVSLGLMPRGGNMQMTLPEGLEPASTVQIALSDEPVGGSPTGQATGPIVAIAPFTRS